MKHVVVAILPQKGYEVVELTTTTNELKTSQKIEFVFFQTSFCLFRLRFTRHNPNFRVLSFQPQIPEISARTSNGTDHFGLV